MINQKQPYLVKECNDYFEYIDQNLEDRNSENYKKVEKEYGKYIDSMVPILWDLITNEILDKCEFVSISLDFKDEPFTFYNLSKSSKARLEEMGLEFPSGEYLPESKFKIDDKFKEYIRSTNFEDWASPDAENLSFYDSNGELLVDMINHEYLIYFYLTEQEASEFEQENYVKLVKKDF